MRRLFFIFFFLLGFGVGAPWAHANERVIDYSLEVSFNIEASKIKGIATFPIKKGEEISLEQGNLNLLDVTLNGEGIEFSSHAETISIQPSRDGKIKIGFEGIFERSGQDGTGNLIDPKGIFLTGTWYPKPGQMCTYHLVAALPEEYEAISEAERIDKARKGDSVLFVFDFPHPLDSITLVAADRYKKVEDRFSGVELLAYFFKEDAHLIPTYLEHAKHYLKLYENLIGKFPYRRFSIVENFLPTGYSMPTYTLLGQEVVRLPFIPETSLGHEILHQWFGNFVYIDTSKGNWAEGLTTYLADHLYEEEKGRGFEYRKGLLIDYQSYVNDQNEFPLKDFRQRTDPASEAIGYGKALMVFQMLKRMGGEDRFYESLRSFTAENRFRKASWGDIQRAFEKYYQKDLAWFFNQWINGKGLAEIILEGAEVKPSGPRFEVSFTVSQKGEIYALDFPVALYSYRGKFENSFHLDKKKVTFKMLIDDIPERLAVDEDYALARKL
ncbi:MAG TPA: M1 family aminopeptidase, partial [Thermodesulfobacteriota bacterium]|nr:M1 family aminopeptidase [Thermodesulfobacteriota bacterium]